MKNTLKKLVILVSICLFLISCLGCGDSGPKVDYDLTKMTSDERSNFEQKTFSERKKYDSEYNGKTVKIKYSNNWEDGTCVYGNTGFIVNSPDEVRKKIEEAYPEFISIGEKNPEGAHWEFTVVGTLQNKAYQNAYDDNFWCKFELYDAEIIEEKWVEE